MYRISRVAPILPLQGSDCPAGQAKGLVRPGLDAGVRLFIRRGQPRRPWHRHRQGAGDLPGGASGRVSGGDWGRAEYAVHYVERPAPGRGGKRGDDGDIGGDGGSGPEDSGGESGEGV